MFEFRFCNLKFFRIQATGFCKNWGMTARVNVMLHPIGWGGHHITRAKMEGNFQSNHQEWAVLGLAQLLAKQKGVDLTWTGDPYC
jgi:hypothetical protein